VGYGKLTDISGVAAFYQMPDWQIAVAGLVEVIGGLLIALGGCVHLGALILGVYVIVVSVMLHLPLTDDLNNTVHFLKNLSILGGLIFVMLSGGGAYQIYKCKCDKK
jgi:putative oxidoreductase